MTNVFEEYIKIEIFLIKALEKWHFHKYCPMCTADPEAQMGQAELVEQHRPI